MRRKNKNTPVPVTLSLPEALKAAKQELDNAYSNFDHVVDPDLIDCYIYQLKSTQMRYRFLLNCAKNEKSMCDAS